MAAAATTWQRMRPRVIMADPGLSNLRTAARVAVVNPLVFAFALLVLDNGQVTLFAFFAVFALLVLGNFGGAPAHRLGALAGTTLAGAALVALGTVASPYPWTAAVATLGVVFVIQFAAMFGGYIAASTVPLILAFVISASLQAPVTQVPQRVAGWMLGGAAATPAAMLLWPNRDRDVLRRSAADALDAVAAFVARMRVDADLTEPLRRADDALARLRADMAGNRRLAGPARRKRALAELVMELQRAVRFATAWTVRHGDSRIPEGDVLAACVVAVLSASGAALCGGPPPDLERLEEARIAHRQALDAWASSHLRAGDDGAQVLDGLEVEHRVRVLSFLTLAMGTNAAIAGGRDVDTHSLQVPYGATVQHGVRAAASRVWRTAAAHFSWTSSLLHTSVRAAIGLAAAVVVARSFSLDRAFWVVLGTLSVLRSSVLATGRSTVQALAGTVIGFVVGGLFTYWFAQDSAVLWAVLPLAVFFAAYAPSAISFTVGQAAFTILLIVVFNLLVPTGWQVGLVRVEDIAIGTGIGLLVSLLVWPRGARADFASAVSRLYRHAAVYFAESLNVQVGKGSMAATTDARADVEEAQEKLGEALDQLLGERSAHHVAPETAEMLVGASDQLVMASETLDVLVDQGYVAADCHEGARQISAQGSAVVASWFMLAERIDGLPAVHIVAVDRAELRQAALQCLDAWRAAPSMSIRPAMAVAWTCDWLELIDKDLRDLEAPADQVALSASVPWWK